MKKQLTGYFLCFVGLCVMFTLCYYYSYKRALKEFQIKADSENYQLIQQLASVGEFKENEINTPSDKESEVLNVNTTDIEKIQAGATLVLESYTLPHNELVTEKESVSNDFVGLTREEVIKKLNAYMQEIPITDYQKGLFAYELVKFSKDEIVLRKSYNQDLIDFKYYVAIRDGYVVVYYSDLKTIYEYTNIIAIELPELERNRLIEGIKIKTNEELYELLESYTS